MFLPPIFFSLSWWFHDIGILWYLILNLWKGLDIENKSYSAILLYARLTHNTLHIMPNQMFIISLALLHLVIFFMYWFIYNSKTNKYTPLILGILIISFIPNHYNPFEIIWWRLLIRLIIYIGITNRLQKQKGLEINKYIIWAWILFVHEITWIFIPFQIVYDTYNYKIDINV